MTVTVLKHAAAAAVLAMTALFSGFACAAERSAMTVGAALANPANRTPPPALGAPPAGQPTGAEIVGKLLAPKASDPDVPLPHPDLADHQAGRSDGPPAPLTGPQIYGRGESGGGIIGFKVPIPVERSGAGPTTRSSGEEAAGTTASQGLSKGR